MTLPRMQFRLWMIMLTVAVSAGVIAELSQRRERLARLARPHRERANACFARIPGICGMGETPKSIEAIFRGDGPTAWLDYQTGWYHGTLGFPYEEAARREWLPLLLDLPPLDSFRNVPCLRRVGAGGCARDHAVARNTRHDCRPPRRGREAGTDSVCR
jgi:hypothetical protein